MDSSAFVAIMNRPESVGVAVFDTDMNSATTHLYCEWQLNESPTEDVPYCTLDLAFRRRMPGSEHSTCQQWPKHSGEAGSAKAFRFVEDVVNQSVLRLDDASERGDVAQIKLILPAVEGYIIRSDIIQRRFLTCHLAEKVVDFSTIGTKVKPFFWNGEDKNALLWEAMHTAVGAIHVKAGDGQDTTDNLRLLDAEMQARLSFSWIIGKPLPKLRLALVDGKGYPHRSTGQLGVYKAAKALGIDLVVVDRDGHWAQDDALASVWRDEFLVCDMTLDDGLPDRVVSALAMSRRPVDAITTYTDKLLPYVAKAAEKLGLHTNPPEAFDISSDKHRTRELATWENNV